MALHHASCADVLLVPFYARLFRRMLILGCEGNQPNLLSYAAVCLTVALVNESHRHKLETTSSSVFRPYGAAGRFWVEGPKQADEA